MADRVLNFKEFADKFSEDSEQNQAASVQDVAAASDNFTQGFDETTYDKSELGPNKPVAVGSEESIAQPGEAGAPSFSSSNSGIESPSESDEEDCEDCEESDEEIESEGNEDESDNEDIEDESDNEDIEDDGSYGNPEGDDDEDDEEDDDSEDDDEEESNESFKWSTSKKIVLESFDNFEGRVGSLDLSHLDMADDEENHGSWEDHNDMYSDNDVELLFNDDDLDIRDIENDNMQPEETDDCFVVCQKCGATKMIEPGDNPMSQDKVDDPDSWWQGAEYGMQCGANPCSN